MAFIAAASGGRRRRGPRPSVRGAAGAAARAAATWRTRASTDGSIFRVKSGLATPMKSARTTSGTRTAASRARQVRQASVLRVRDLAVEHALHHPEDVGRGQDHARARPPPRSAGLKRPGAHQDQELAHEAVEAGHRDRGQADQQEQRREPGHDASCSPPNSAMSAGVAAVVEHAHHEEERARRDAVVQHLVDGAHDRRAW